LATKPKKEAVKITGLGFVKLNAKQNTKYKTTEDNNFTRGAGGQARPAYSRVTPVIQPAHYAVMPNPHHQ